MKKNYDFSQGKRNPYARRLKRQITIRLDEDTLAYFKGLAEEAE
ncbi:MAG TPA: BrnA antitoxin family protein, partial [Myxococcota bacterium]|nr:BrnA antitoxin family protein [Myxococcota bacterium]